MDISSVFGGDSLKAADLQGREHTVFIAAVDMKKFDNGNKLVIKFVGKQKALICNKTNANRIAYIYGKNTDNWIGKEIILYVDLVDFQGNTTEAIRIRPPVKREPIAQPQTIVDRDGYAVSTASGVRPSQRDGLEEALDGDTKF